MRKSFLVSKKVLKKAAIFLLCQSLFLGPPLLRAGVMGVCSVCAVAAPHPTPPERRGRGKVNPHTHVHFPSLSLSLSLFLPRPPTALFVDTSHHWPFFGFEVVLIFFPSGSVSELVFFTIIAVLLQISHHLSMGGLLLLCYFCLGKKLCVFPSKCQTLGY